MLKRFYEQAADLQKNKGDWPVGTGRRHLGFTSTWRRLPAVVMAIVATFMTALVAAFMFALMSTFVTPLFAESPAVIAGIHQLSPICCCVRLSPQACT